MAARAAWDREATPRELAVLALAAIGSLAVVALAVWRLDPGDRATTTEADVYYAFADAVTDGAVPYRDVTIEYPPGALPVFLVPERLLGSTTGARWGEAAANPAAHRYEAALAATLTALLAATIAVTATSLRLLRATRGRALVALGVLASTPLLLGALPLTRYDAWPVLLASLGLLAALAGRTVWAGTGLGLAATAKLYPLVVLPGLVARGWQQGGHRRAVALAGAAGGAALGALAPFLALAPGGTLDAVRLQVSRGLQMESLGGVALASVWKLTLSLDAHGLVPAPLPVDSCQRCGGLVAAQLTGTLADVVGAVSTVAVVAIVVLVVRRAREPAADGPEVVAWVTATSVTALVAVGKVLSAQFLLWLLPLVPLVAGRRGSRATVLLVVAAVMTNVWFPGLYRDYVNLLAPGPLAFLLLRDAVLVGLLAVLLWPERRVAA